MTWPVALDSPLFVVGSAGAGPGDTGPPQALWELLGTEHFNGHPLRWSMDTRVREELATDDFQTNKVCNVWEICSMWFLVLYWIQFLTVSGVLVLSGVTPFGFLSGCIRFPRDTRASSAGDQAKGVKGPAKAGSSGSIFNERLNYTRFIKMGEAFCRMSNKPSVL